jgi:hypothetical protein
LFTVFTPRREPPKGRVTRAVIDRTALGLFLKAGPLGLH